MRRILPLLAALVMLLSGCAGAPEAGADFVIACTTYPVYLLANSIAGEMDGVEVSLVINQQVSCLHDYALTVSDMKTLEHADAVAINGAGLEDFLGDAVAGKNVIDCDEGIDLLRSEDEHGEEHEGQEHHHDGADPHIWMDPRAYAQMARTLAQGLAALDEENARRYLEQGERVAEELEAFYLDLTQSEAAQQVRGREIITFHDGFAYFANAFGLHIAAAIEEEEGAEASAKELKRTIQIVEEEHLSAVFTEVNGSANAARIIARECGVETYPLSMVMSGSRGDTISAYEQAITRNLETIMEAYQ